MTDLDLFSVHPYVVWLVAGLALCAAETFVPGAFLIWIGLAAVALGGIEFFVAIELTPALLLFAALVVVFVFIGRRVYGSLDSGAPPLPLSRAHALIGKEFYLDEAIERDASWITLEVRETNDVAQKLYRKYGFTVVSTRRGYYSDNNESALVMWAGNLRGTLYANRLAALKAALR